MKNQLTKIVMSASATKRTFSHSRNVIKEKSRQRNATGSLAEIKKADPGYKFLAEEIPGRLIQGKKHPSRPEQKEAIITQRRHDSGPDSDRDNT